MCGVKLPAAYGDGTPNIRSPAGAGSKRSRARLTLVVWASAGAAVTRAASEMTTPASRPELRDRMGQFLDEKKGESGSPWSFPRGATGRRPSAPDAAWRAASSF